MKGAGVTLCLALSCWGYAGQIALDARRDVGMSAEMLGRVSTAVQELVDEEKTAGASVLVVHKGKVVCFERRIFAPLGMEGTAFHASHDKADRFAVCDGPRLGKGLRVSGDPRKDEGTQGADVTEAGC